MASGHPDYYDGIVSYGEYAGLPKVLAVDSSGNLVTLIKANDTGTLRTVTCDAAGNLQISLIASSANVASLLTIGNVLQAVGDDVTPINQAQQTLVLNSFKCNVLHFSLNAIDTSGNDISGDLCQVIYDFPAVVGYSFSKLLDFNMVNPIVGLPFLTKYDTVNKSFSIQMNGPIAVNSSFKVVYTPTHFATTLLNYSCIYGKP